MEFGMRFRRQDAADKVNDRYWHEIEGMPLDNVHPIQEELLRAQSAVINVAAGTIIFGPGNSPENMLFLLDGSVRVQQTSESGHEIVLYRLHAGQSCVLTTACLLAYEDYAAEGICETDISAAAIPRALFDDLVASTGARRLRPAS